MSPVVLGAPLLFFPLRAVYTACGAVFYVGARVLPVASPNSAWTWWWLAPGGALALFTQGSLALCVSEVGEGYSVQNLRGIPWCSTSGADLGLVTIR